MSDDTTTIEIRNDQQEALSDLKQHDRESYKAVLDRLLEGDTDTDTDAMQVVPVEEVVGREVPQADLSGPVELEATEYRKIADEVAGRLR